MAINEQNEHDGTLTIDTRIDTSGCEKGMKAVTASADRANRSFERIGRTVKKIGGLIAGAFAIKKLADFGKECIELGSDLAEVQNVVDSVFTTMSGQVDAFAKSAASMYGLSETMAKKFTGTFGGMAKAFGFTEKEALDMSTTLAGLAGDVASFYNIDQEAAFTKLKSVFSGETESLKDLGIVMTQSALDQYALANGISKTTKDMSEQEKVALRYRFILDQLSTASGDFAKTSGGWANQMRILKLQFDSLKATIGQGLINVFTPVLRVINALLAKLATLANAFKSFTELITGNRSSGATTQAAAGLTAIQDATAGAADSTSNLADAQADNTSALREARREQDKYLSGLDEMRKWQEKAAADSGREDENSPNIASSILPAGVGAVDYGNLASGSTAMDKLSEKMKKLYDTIVKGCRPAVDALKNLWENGLKKLGDFVWTGLKDFYDHFLVPVGRWVLGEGIPRFVNALNDGLMNIDFGRINQCLADLWDALAPFAINIGEGLLWFWENVLVPLGTWVGNEVVPRFLTTLTIAINIFNSVLEAMKPVFQWFWDNVLLPLAEWTGEKFLAAWDWINDKLQKFSDWCRENPETVAQITTAVIAFFAAWKFVSLILGILSFIKTAGSLVGLIGSVFNPVALAIGLIAAAGVLVVMNWDKIKAKASEIWEAVKTKVVETWSAIKTKATEIWEGIKTTLTEKWNSLKSTATKKFELIRSKVSSVWSVLKSSTSAKWAAITSTLTTKWKEIKEKANSIFTTVKGKISTAWTSLKTKTKSLGDAFNTFKEEKLSVLSDFISGTFSGAIEGLQSIFGDLIGFITGTFSTDWESAWNGVVSFFGSVWEGFVDFVKTPINTAIQLINNAINWINDRLSGIEDAFSFQVQVAIPEWMGGNGTTESVGVDMHGRLPRINAIPELAKGAVIPPNAPFTAVLGDQKRGTNIEAPLETIEQALRNVMGEYMEGRNGGTYKFIAQLNRRVLFDEVMTEADLRRSQSGRNPFEMG